MVGLSFVRYASVSAILVCLCHYRGSVYRPSDLRYALIATTLAGYDISDAPLIPDEVYGRLEKDEELDGGRAARKLYPA